MALDRSVRSEVEAIAREIPDHAVFYVQRSTGPTATASEVDAVVGDSGAVNFQAGQDDVARNRTDGDGSAGRGTRYCRPAVAVDGDRAGDGDRPIFAGIERRDNAVGPDHGVGVRERGTRRRDGAGIGVDPCRRDERTGERSVLSLRGYGWQSDGERERCRHDGGAGHWKTP